MAQQLEERIRRQVEDVALVPRVEVVRAEDLVAVVQQPFAQVGAKESGAAGDKNAFFHIDAPLRYSSYYSIYLAHACNTVRELSILSTSQKNFVVPVSNPWLQCFFRIAADKEQRSDPISESFRRRRVKGLC